MIHGRRLPGRTALVLVAVALAVLAAGACTNDDDGTEGQTSDTSAGAPVTGKALATVQDGKLTACTDVANAPFEFEQDGQFDGIDIELVKAVAGRLALGPDFKVVETRSILGALEDRQCDLVASSLAITEERLQTVDFSDAYFEVRQSLLVRTGAESTYDDLAKLSGRTIGVQSGSAGAGFAQENAKGATIREFADDDELFSNLEAGRIDAAVHDLPVGAYRAKTTGRTVVAKTFTEGDSVHYGFALRKGEVELKRTVDDALRQVRADDTYPTILRRFLGDTAGQI